MEDWKEYRLDELYVFGNGLSKGSKYFGYGHPFVSFKTVFNNYFLPEELSDYVDSDEKEQTKCSVQKSDVLLTRTSETVNELGYSCVALRDYPKATFNGFCKRMRPITEGIIHDLYAGYYFRSSHFRNQVCSMSNMVTRASLSNEMLGRLTIKLPSYKTQTQIGELLFSIDRKIALNRQINDNLELQAQNIFNHYFIDNPIELGSYSEGVLTDIAVYLNGLAMQKFRPEGSDFGLPVLKIKELGQRSCDNNSDRCSSLIKEEYIVNDGDVIFSWSGTLLVDLWCGGKCGLNQHLFKVTSDTYPKWFYYFWTKHHLDNFIRVAKDKAVTMGHIKRTELEKANIIVPTQDKLSEINRIMSPIITKIINHRVEMRKLGQLRDIILPQLMSGELKINEIDC